MKDKKVVIVNNKTTVWEKYIVETENPKDVINFLKINNTSELLEEFIGTYSETIYETMEDITPFENGGEPTVEIFSECILLWDNTPKENTIKKYYVVPKIFYIGDISDTKFKQFATNLNFIYEKDKLFDFFLKGDISKETHEIRLL